MSKKRVFLDNASTTPIAPEIIDMMSKMMKSHFANPSSVHSYGRESKIIIEGARKKIAELLNTSPSRIPIPSILQSVSNLFFCLFF